MIASLQADGQEAVSERISAASVHPPCLQATFCCAMSVLSQSESSQHGPRQPHSAMMVQDMAPPASMQPGVAVVPSTQCNSSAVQQRNSLDGYDGTDAEVDDHMRETDDMREGEDKTDDEGDDSDTNTKRGGNKVRKPHLQGRFSGRLETKADEKRLADECKLLGHLLGGVGKRGEKSRLTLAKIVRGIASGDVRKHCEAREQLLQVRATVQHCSLMVMTGPLIDDAEQMLCTQKMSDSCRTARAHCTYFCSVNTLCP